MKSRIPNIIKSVMLGVIIAGIIILIIGFYYKVGKAGIPYQDPTLEMQIDYTVNDRIGSVLLKVGFIVGVVGVAGRFVLWILGRRNK